MRKIKEVLRLKFSVGLGLRQIARSCSIGLGTVHEYLQRAEAAGVKWPLGEDLDEDRLEAILFGGPPRVRPAVLPMPDFAELLAAIRAALKPDGFYVCVDIECSDNVAENTGPLAALRYAYSVLYCMTTSLAAGGEGLGTLGLTESKMRGLCADAGFRSLRKVPLKDSINAVYEARP